MNRKYNRDSRLTYIDQSREAAGSRAFYFAVYFLPASAGSGGGKVVAAQFHQETGQSARMSCSGYVYLTEPVESPCTARRIGAAFERMLERLEGGGFIRRPEVNQ